MEIREEETFLKMAGAINYVLDIRGSAYSVDLVDCKAQGTNGYSDYGQRLLCIDEKIWNAFVDSSDCVDQRMRYAISAGVLAHEIMHFYQFYNSTIEYQHDFLFEQTLPLDSKTWTNQQRVQYFNLSIEIEAFAFGMLVEEILFFDNRVSPLPNEMDKTKYNAKFAELKENYESKIRIAFCNIINKK